MSGLHVTMVTSSRSSLKKKIKMFLKKIDIIRKGAENFKFQYFFKFQDSTPVDNVITVVELCSFK
jgi:hypothetical protein